MNSKSQDGILDNNEAVNHQDSEQEVIKTKSSSLERLDAEKDSKDQMESTNANDSKDQKESTKDKEKQYRMNRNILESSRDVSCSFVSQRLTGSSATASKVQTSTAASHTNDYGNHGLDLVQGNSNTRINNDTKQSLMERRMDQKQQNTTPAGHPGAVVELTTPITTTATDSSFDTTTTTAANMTITEMKSLILTSHQANHHQQQQQHQDEETLIQNKTVGEVIKSAGTIITKESEDDKEINRTEQESTNLFRDLEDQNSHYNVQPGSQAIHGPDYVSERSVREFKDDESSEFMMLHDDEPDKNNKSSEVMLHAELVVDDKERIVIEEVERERIANVAKELAKEELVSQAIKAQVVSVDEEEHSKRKRLIILGVCIIAILLIVGIVIGVVVGMKDSESADVVIDDVPTIPPTSYLDGENFFSTTQQLYNAVNDYMVGLRNTSMEVESLPVYQFYGPIERWNVSGLSNFSWVFDVTWYLEGDEEHPFDADLGDWDVSKATTLIGMFYSCYNFQGIGIEKWDVSKVTDFSYMFYDNFNFNNKNLSSWNTSNAKNMELMFSGSGISEESGIEYWDVSNVESMEDMFSYSYFAGDVSLWNTTSTKNMKSMFSNSLFGGEVTNFNTERVTDMSYMFERTDFDGNLSHFDTSEVFNMSSMFAKSAFSGRNGDIGGWNVKNCIDMGEMFAGASDFNQDLSTWDVKNVDNFNRMFYNAEQFNLSLCMWGALMTLDNIVEDMFKGSGCKNSTDPDISRGGPLCHSCI